MNFRKPLTPYIFGLIITFLILYFVINLSSIYILIILSILVFFMIIDFSSYVVVNGDTFTKYLVMFAISEFNLSNVKRIELVKINRVGVIQIGKPNKKEYEKCRVIFHNQYTFEMPTNFKNKQNMYPWEYLHLQYNIPIRYINEDKYKGSPIDY